jgi:hypothetical protein
MMKSWKFASLAVLLVAALLAGAAAVAQPNALNRAGKIWYDEGFLYVNIIEQGVLVINNYDARNPQKVGFIEIPGNVDIAVRGRTLYANSYADLVAIDITDLNQVRELKRIPNVFSHRRNNGGWQASPIAWRNGDNLTNFLNTLFRNPLNNTSNNWSGNRNNNNGGFFGGLGNLGTTGVNPSLAMNAAPAASNRPASQAPAGGGKGGSMACFTLVDNFLYAIDAQHLQVFDIANAASPEQRGQKTQINFDIETIFAYGDRLFIGGQSGMYIYSIANRMYPQREGHYRHTRSCDPVVVEGNYAYVTLRDGTDCGGSVNQLDVLDISNPQNPRKIQTYRMTNPHGLGIDNGLLFICDGRDGLKVFDARDPNAISRNQIAHFSGMQAFDVIPDNSRKILMMVSPDKITQYDYNNFQNVQLLSEISLF